MASTIDGLEEFAELQRAWLSLAEALRGSVGPGEAAAFERSRVAAYQLASSLNELAWEVWDHPFLPEMGAPDPVGPYGFTEPHVIATFVMEDFDPEVADEALEGVAEDLHRTGLTLARTIYVRGAAGDGGGGVHETEAAGPTRRLARRLRSTLRRSRSGGDPAS